LRDASAALIQRERRKAKREKESERPCHGFRGVVPVQSASYENDESLVDLTLRRLLLLLVSPPLVLFTLR